jgi:bifunctional non-homologous end joining protein LigD
MLSRSPFPTGFVEPCLPTASRTVPDGSRWAFEVKHDGFRFIARRDGERVRVFSRNARDWTDRVPLIVEAAAWARQTGDLHLPGLHLHLQRNSPG